MDSSTYQQLANQAKANANRATSQAALAQSNLDTIASDDPQKFSLQSKIASLKNSATSYNSEANVHSTEARSAQIKEDDKAHKEIEDEQKAIQEEETKKQEKLEQQNKEKLAEKASLKEEKSFNRFIDGDESTEDEELSFLNQDRAPTHFAQVEEIVDFNYVAEVKDSAQVSKADNKKDSEEDQKLVKALDGAGTAGA
jgi:hypothetical protein